MLFDNLVKKYELLKEALKVENSIEKITQNITNLKKEEDRLNKKVADQKDTNKIIKTEISKLGEKSTAINSDLAKLKSSVEKQESKLVPLKKKWDNLNKEEKTLIKYFSNIS